MTATVIHLPARRAGKVLAREAAVDGVVLALLYQNGGEVAADSLFEALHGCSRRDVWRSLSRQRSLGNIRPVRTGEPITLTASARTAIMAGAQYCAQPACQMEPA